MITSICTTVYIQVYQLLLKSINIYNYNYSMSQATVDEVLLMS